MPGKTKTIGLVGAVAWLHLPQHGHRLEARGGQFLETPAVARRARREPVHQCGAGARVLEVFEMADIGSLVEYVAGHRCGAHRGTLRRC